MTVINMYILTILNVFIQTKFVDFTFYKYFIPS